MASGEKQAALWNPGAKVWATTLELVHMPLWTKMQEVAEVGPASNVLDVGCGGGNALKLAKSKGARVSGMDSSQALIDFAKTIVDGDFRVGDMENLPFDDNTFNVVLATNSIQYSEDKVKSVSEIKRVKTADGKVVIGMWSEAEKCEMAGLFTVLKELAPPPPSSGQPLDLSVRETLLETLRLGGLNPIEDGEVDVPEGGKDVEDFYRMFRSAGPAEAVAKAVGEERLKEALFEYSKPYVKADGSLLFENKMRYVLAI